MATNILLTWQGKIIPALCHGHPWGILVGNASCVYNYLMVMVNYMLLIYYHRYSLLKPVSGLLPRTAPADNDEERRFCHYCAILRPPRAKHCFFCARCVLKFDHHCFLSGSCVGFHNQRYFIAFSLHALLGTACNTVGTVWYLNGHAEPRSRQLHHYLLPWVIADWMQGRLQLKLVVMVFWGTVSFLMTFASCFTCVSQCILLHTGQTTYEWIKHRTSYRRPLSENIKSVFGSWGILYLIVPIPSLDSPDNGVDWNVTHEVKIL